MTNKKSRSSKFLRYCIFEALMLLMQEKKYEDIPISEITAKAGVSRMTYYRTYKSKDDILLQYYEEYVNDHLQRDDESFSWNRFIRIIIQGACDNPKLMEVLENNPRLAKITIHFFINKAESLLKKAEDIVQLDENVIYAVYYYAGAVSMVISHWNRAGRKQNVEELMNILHQCQYNLPF